MRSLVLAALVAATTAGINGPVVADGKRWAAWEPSAQVALVYDDRTRRRRRVAIPDCPLAGVTAGLLLLECPGVDPAYADDPVLVEVASGRVTNLGGPDLVPEALATLRFVGLGSRGLLVDVQGYHYRDLYAFDWHTRRRRDLDDPYRVVDLNRRSLTRPLCRGLQRSPDPEYGQDVESVPPYLPMAYSHRRAVEYVSRRLRLWRCGDDRPRRIKRCACRDAGIGAGLATWADTRARALDVASGERRSWTFPRGYGHVAQAGRTLLLWTDAGRLRIVRWRR
jgi:hypothetical protein